MLLDKVKSYLNRAQEVESSLRAYDDSLKIYMSKMDEHIEDKDTSKISAFAKDVLVSRENHKAQLVLLDISQRDVVSCLTEDENLTPALEILLDISISDVKAKQKFVSSFIDVVEERLDATPEDYAPLYEQLLDQAREIDLNDPKKLIKTKLNYDNFVFMITYKKLLSIDSNLAAEALITFGKEATPNFFLQHIKPDEIKSEPEFPMYA